MGRNKNEKETTILDINTTEDPIKRIIGTVILGLVPIPLIVAGASLAYDAYTKWEKSKGEKK